MKRISTAALALAAGILLLIACDAPGQPAIGTQPTAVIGSTPTSDPKPDNSGPPPTYPPLLPTPTLSMGMIRTCGDLGGIQYWFDNCWRGVVNGQLISVAAGGEKPQLGGKGQPAPPPAAVFLVFHGPYLLGSDSHPEVYKVAGGSRLGIQSIEGTRFTLVLVDNYNNVVPGTKPVVFDLSTRQWVSP